MVDILQSLRRSAGGPGRSLSAGKDQRVVKSMKRRGAENAERRLRDSWSSSATSAPRRFYSSPIPQFSKGILFDLRFHPGV